MKEIMESFEQLLFHWQDLAGSLLGAFIPITISICILYFQYKNNFRRTLTDTSILVAQAITDMYETREELDLLERRLNAMIAAVNSAQGGYFIGHTNFPTFKLDYGNRFLDVRTKSLYLTNKFLLCHTVIKRLDAILQDMQFEFHRAVAHDHERLLSAKDLDLGPDTQKNLLKVELEGTLTAIKLARLNISFVSRALIAANTYLNHYLSYPKLTRWRYEGFIHQTLRNKKGEFVAETYLASEIEKAIQEIEGKYTSNFSLQNSLAEDNSS